MFYYRCIDVSQTIVSGDTTTTTPHIELTPFFSGIALDVTPQISKSKDILLHIHPSVSEVTERQKIITIGNSTQNLPLAFSTARESDSIIRAKNGQVVIIGGLMKNQNRETQSSVPLLGDIPLIGGWFRQTQQSSVKSEVSKSLRAVLPFQL